MTVARWIGVLLLLRACLLPAQQMPAHKSTVRELNLAAASDLQFTMPEIVARFQKQTGQSVNIVYGSSGNFVQQIQNGAPFDLFFSANLGYAQQLEAEGLADPGSLYEYATGRLVLWVPGDSPVDLSRGLEALLDPSIRKVAIANPQHAPYGQAAVAALQQHRLYDRLYPRLVLGENISQAASFLTSGAADAGIIALSLALSPGMKDKGRYVEVPAADYPAIRQACVILKSSRNKRPARWFLDFLRTPAVVDLLKTHGFAVP